MSKEDERGLVVLEQKTKNVGNRYEVPMFWMCPEVSLPNNYAMVLCDGCQAVLDVDPPYARKLTESEQPGKIRLVNDPAIEYQRRSLKKSLLTGPDLVSSLVGILLRLRNNPVAVVAILEAMFHLVRVSEADLDFLRFL